MRTPHTTQTHQSEVWVPVSQKLFHPIKIIKITILGLGWVHSATVIVVLLYGIRHTGQRHHSCFIGNLKCTHTHTHTHTQVGMQEGKKRQMQRYTISFLDEKKESSKRDKVRREEIRHTSSGRQCCFTTHLSEESMQFSNSFTAALILCPFSFADVSNQAAMFSLSQKLHRVA